MSSPRDVPVRRFIAPSAVTVVGLLAFLVPLYDIWDDLTNLGWHLPATLIENATLLLLAALLVCGGLWLFWCDWEVEHVTTVATWNVAGTLSTALLFGWIVYIQRWAMHGYKPLVIAMDGVLIASIATFGIGVYSAKRDRKHERLRAERDRFAGLFENTSDAVVAVALDSGDPVIETVNDRFRQTFSDARSVFGDAVDAVDGDPTLRSIRERVLAGETIESTIRREVDGEERSYVVRFVPYDAGQSDHLYVIVTDITEQQELARQREATDRLTSLHAFAGELQDTDAVADAYEIALDAVDDLLCPAAVRIVLDGETVAERRTDEVETDSAGADGGTTAPETDRSYTARIGDRGSLTVFSGEFAEQEIQTVDLLGTHLDRTLARLDRKREARAEREQLEFVNQTVRHNLLNSIQIVQGHLDLVVNGDDSFEAHQDVITERIDEMADFIETMRAYMKTLVEGEGHDLRPVALRPTLESEIESVRESFDRAEIEVGDVPDVSVRADDLLGPVFENLLTNAVEHNDQDTPRVRVDVDPMDGAVAVTVADNGPGVPDGYKEDIFEQGELGERSSGSGFGLYLVKTAVESYGGSVDVEDNDPTGAVFRIALPLVAGSEVASPE